MMAIYTPGDVADLLEMDPAEVEGYLDAGLFAGFKVESQWRITATSLNRSLDTLQGIERSIRLKSLDGAPAGSGAAALAPPRIPIAVENPSPSRHDAVGQLLVFSDMPGEAVYLDGELKGPTTLSLMNVTVGAHELTIGEVSSAVTVVKNYQLRVKKKNGEIQVSSHPRIVTRHRQTDDATDQEAEEYRLSIDVENETDYAGPFVVNVSAEHATSNAEIFGLVDGEIHAQGLRIREFIPDHDAASLFNGTIKAHPGDRIFISVPRQDGFNGTTELVAVMQSDSYIKLTLTNSGLLGRKQAIKFKTQSAPH